jgi:hypothetical protein
MSGVARQVGKIFKSDDTRQAMAAESQRQAAATPAAPARMASPEERAIALRRRRGTRALLSEERMEAEAGLGGQQTTLGG